MRKRKLLILLTLLTLLLAGCKKSSSVDTNTIEVDKDGMITSTIIEDFDKDYYLEEELKQAIDNEIAEYNSAAGENAATVEKFNVKDKKVNVVIQFATANDYATLNNIPLFAGTIEEAIAAGYDFDSTFTKITKGKVDGEDTFKAADIVGLSDYKVIIVQETTAVAVPGNIAYISEGITIRGKKSANFTIAGIETDIEESAANDTASEESNSTDAPVDTSAGTTDGEIVPGIGYIIYK